MQRELSEDIIQHASRRLTRQTLALMRARKRKADFGLLLIQHLQRHMPDEHSRCFQFNGESKPLSQDARNTILLLLNYSPGLLDRKSVV